MRYVALSAIAMALLAGTAFAADPMTKTTVQMTEAQEVPPHNGNATGTAIFTIDPAAKTVSWTVNWQNLSSDAVAAHIHGPAAPGVNAGVLVNLAPNGMKNPLEGSATISDAQIADLMRARTTSTSTPPPTRAARFAVRSCPRCKLRNRESPPPDCYRAARSRAQS